MRNMSPEDSLRQALSRVTPYVAKILDARPFFFLAPPFINRKDEEYVQYYGLDTPSADERPHSIFRAAVADFFSRTPPKNSPHVSIQELDGVIKHIKAQFRGNFPNAAVSDLAYRAALTELQSTKVKVATRNVAGSTRLTLLDYALDFANTQESEKSDFISAANAEIRSQCYEGSTVIEFRSNQHFFSNDTDQTLFANRTPPDGWQAPDYEAAANTIWSTNSYFTWRSYVTLEDELQGSLCPFIAELMVTKYFESIETNSSTREAIKIADLRQTHLPLAAFGQFRGSLCWITHNGRRVFSCRNICRRLDRAFQSLLSEQFAGAVLSAFRESFSAAVSNRGPASEYFRSLSVAFCLLIYAEEVYFFKDHYCVAGSSGGEIFTDGPAANSPQSLPESGPQSPLVTQKIDEKRTLLVVDIAGLVSASKGEIPGLGRNDLASHLGFDKVVFRAMHIHDERVLQDSAGLIRDAIVSVVTVELTRRNSLKVKLAQDLGHRVKHAFIETLFQSTSRDLNGLLRNAARSKPDQEAVDVPIRLLEDLRYSFQACSVHFSIAEAFRRVDVLSEGFIPHEWLRPDYLEQLQGEAALLRVSDTLERVVLGQASTYARLVTDTIRGTKAPRIVLKCLRTGIDISLPDRAPISLDLPGFRDDRMGAGSVALLSGLMELSRNAFKYVTEKYQSIGRLSEDRILPVWMTVDSCAATRSATVKVCNPVVDSIVSSKSLESLVTATRMLACVSIKPPEGRDVPPPKALAGCQYLQSEFTIRPSAIRASPAGSV